MTEDKLEEYSQIYDNFKSDVRSLMDDIAGTNNIREAEDTRRRLEDKLDGLSWMLALITKECLGDKIEGESHKIRVEDVNEDKNYRSKSYEIHFGDELGTHTWRKSRITDTSTFKNKNEFCTPFLDNGFPESLADECGNSGSIILELAEEIRKISNILQMYENNKFNIILVPVSEKDIISVYTPNGSIRKKSNTNDNQKIQEAIESLREGKSRHECFDCLDYSDRNELDEIYEIRTSKIWEKRTISKLVKHSDEVERAMDKLEDRISKREDRVDRVTKEIQELCRNKSVVALSL